MALAIDRCGARLVAITAARVEERRREWRCEHGNISDVQKKMKVGRIMKWNRENIMGTSESKPRYFGRD
jgi:hypothetical protein